MNTKKSITGVALVAFVAGLVVACNGNSTADSGVSLAAFQKLQQQVADLSKTSSARASTINDLTSQLAAAQKAIADLQADDPQAEIAALKKQLHIQVVTTTAPKQNVQTARYVESLTPQAATTTTPTVVGTLIGYTPAGTSPTGARGITVSTATGYEVNYNVGETANTVAMAAKIYYVQADCQGTPYLSSRNTSDFSLQAARSGFVFRNTTELTNTDDASTYWYVPKGSQRTSIVPVSDTYRGLGGCEPSPDADLTLTYVWAALPNDPTVTGAPNAQTPPTAISTPQ